MSHHNTMSKFDKIRAALTELGSNESFVWQGGDMFLFPKRGQRIRIPSNKKSEIKEILATDRLSVNIS